MVFIGFRAQGYRSYAVKAQDGVCPYLTVETTSEGSREAEMEILVFSPSTADVCLWFRVLEFRDLRMVTVFGN